MEKVTGRSARVYRKQRKGAGMKPSLFGALVIGVISLALCVEVEARPSSRRACSDEIIRGGNSEKALITCPSWAGDRLFCSNPRPGAKTSKFRSTSADCGGKYEV